GVVTLIRPALPLLSVVLKTPLAAPARDTDSPALTVTLPPAPPVGLVLVVLLWIWPPFVTLNVLSSVTTMSPAAPAPCVVTDIFAPSLSVSVGVVTMIWPAFPVLSAVLKTPPAAPARDTDCPASIVTVPPCPAAWVPLSIRAPPVTARLLRLSAMSTAVPPPSELHAHFTPS